MKNLLEIERAIEKLPPEDYGRLRDWIGNYELERDAGAATACIAEMLDEEVGGRGPTDRRMKRGADGKIIPRSNKQ